ncbi:MAG: hypothetical protein JXR70_04885 [Spirochaetales bacterium]|nr:hypothetical protein [Spirochaetales bacterium]
MNNVVGVARHPAPKMPPESAIRKAHLPPAGPGFPGLPKLFARKNRAKRLQALVFEKTRACPSHP